MPAVKRPTKEDHARMVDEARRYRHALYHVASGLRPDHVVFHSLGRAGRPAAEAREYRLYRSNSATGGLVVTLYYVGREVTLTDASDLDDLAGQLTDSLPAFHRAAVLELVRVRDELNEEGAR